MSPTTPEATADPTGLDYATLRDSGIGLLQRMAGTAWTDYNEHDPGLTILEQVCYALTDLAYRIDYPVEDLLASGVPAAASVLPGPAKVLTTSPLTVNDLRKVVIDVAGVKNAWVEPLPTPDPAFNFDPTDGTIYLEAAPQRRPVALRGVRRVIVEPDGSVPAPVLTPAVDRRLHSCRPVGEDFEPTVVLKVQKVIVRAAVEIGDVRDPDRLLAEVYHRIARHIAPHVRFYSLGEMLARGKAIDDIFNGPRLRHGFIDDDELRRFDRKTALHTSDVIREIMAVDGVRSVLDISLSAGGATEPWYLELDPSSTPALDLDTSLFPDPSSANSAPAVRLFKGRTTAATDATRVRLLFGGREAASVPRASASAQAPAPPQGRDRNVARYYSILHQFPESYGVGESGLPDSATDERRAQARQLKAYLLFFDQILANAFTQLAGVSRLLSADPGDEGSYFAQAVDDPRLKLDELRVRDPAAHRESLRRLTENPADPGSGPDLARRDRFHDHLLARFAEDLTEYTLAHHATDPATVLTAARAALLRDAPGIGYERGRGFNRTRPSWGTDNVSGLEKRVARKLGLSSYVRRPLAGLAVESEGGFHLVEHVLLRPVAADAGQWARTGSIRWQPAAVLASPVAPDPYSLRLSFVFPTFITGLGGDTAGRAFVERTVREETPAHLSVDVHWLDRDPMALFEAAYRDWLDALADPAAGGDE